MKKVFLLFIFVIFILISSVSANEFNSTDSDVYSTSDSSVPVQGSNISEVSLASENLMANEGIDSNQDNNKINNAPNDDLIINPDFSNDLNGWDHSSNVIIEEGTDAHGFDGKYVKFSAKNDYISQNIDWTDIDSLSFYVKNGPSLTALSISIEGFQLSSDESTMAIAKNTDWTEKIINTSTITGYAKLTISIATKRTIYLDLFTSLKEELPVDFNINSYVDTPTYFNYTTSDIVDKWYWDFGDESYSNDSNPIHIYNTTGIYRGNLTIYNDTDTKVLTFSVEVIEKLNADFSYSTRDNGDVYIVTQSTGNIVNWSLDNGNGVTVNSEKSFSRTFNYPQGSYKITLNVTDKFGNVDSITKDVTVIVYYTTGYAVESYGFENTDDGWTLSDGASISTDYQELGYGAHISGAQYIEKIINFDNIDTLELDAYSYTPNSGGNRHLYLYIDGNEIGDRDLRANSWSHISYSNINLVGYHTVRLQGQDDYYLDNINLITHSYYLANFTNSIIDINGDDITVKFNDNSYGTYNILWTFDGKNTSTLRNPTFTFKKGTHEVSLTIYKDNIKMSSVTKILSLDLPTIGDNTYVTIQDAINAANAGDVIDIPNMDYKFSENLLINKSLTLNFNGAILSAEDTSIPLFNITEGATVTVTNIGLDKDTTLVTDNNSKLIIKDSDIGVNLVLSEGNIDLLDDLFNNSVLTIIANTNITNSTISGGAVIVNNGKSKIFNTTITGCDVAITQTAGELDIISNLITDNNIAINITGGTKTNIEYNLIYSNAKFGLVYVGENVTNTNNWWGNKDEPLSFNDKNLSDSYWDIYRLEDIGSEFNSYLTLKFTTSESVMGTNKEYPVNIEIINDDGEKVTGYLKTIDLTIITSSASYYATLENGNGQFTITTPNAEVNGITLTVLGSNYVLNTPVRTKTNVFITVVGEAVVNGSIVVNVEVPYATGNVKFYVDDDVKTVELNNTKASYTISNLTSGKHNIFAVYEGNEIFNSIYNSTSIEVPESEDYNKTISDLKTQLEEAQNNATNLANELEKSKDNTTNLTNSLNDANKQVENLTTKLNEAQDNVTKLTNSLSDANNKADNLTAQLSEAQKTIQSLSSDLISTTISANNLAIKASDNGNIQVTLIDANNNLLANKSVQVIINGVSYKGTTNNNGIASITVKYANAGTYNAVVLFLGDDAYKGSIGTSKVTVNKKATTLTAKKATLKVKKAKKIKVTLKSDGKAVAGKTITIKVNKKTFKAKTNSKGVATIKVKVAKKGNFKAVVKFAGDSAYKAITMKLKLTVKK